MPPAGFGVGPDREERDGGDEAGAGLALLDVVQRHGRHRHQQRHEHRHVERDRERTQHRTAPEHGDEQAEHHPAGDRGRGADRLEDREREIAARDDRCGGVRAEPRDRRAHRPGVDAFGDQLVRAEHRGEEVLAVADVAVGGAVDHRPEALDEQQGEQAAGDPDRDADLLPVRQPAVQQPAVQPLDPLSPHEREQYPSVGEAGAPDGAGRSAPAGRCRR